MKMHKQLCGFALAQSFQRHFAANKFIPDTRRLDNDSVGINFFYIALYMCVHIFAPCKKRQLFDAELFNHRSERVRMAECRAERIGGIIGLRYLLQF